MDHQRSRCNACSIYWTSAASCRNKCGGGQATNVSQVNCLSRCSCAHLKVGVPLHKSDTPSIYLFCLTLCYSQAVMPQKSGLVQSAPNNPSRGPRSIPCIIHPPRETAAAVVVPDFFWCQTIGPVVSLLLAAPVLHIEADFWLLKSRTRR